MKPFFVLALCALFFVALLILFDPLPSYVPTEKDYILDVTQRKMTIEREIRRKIRKNHSELILREKIIYEREIVVESADSDSNEQSSLSKKSSAENDYFDQELLELAKKLINDIIKIPDKMYRNDLYVVWVKEMKVASLNFRSVDFELVAPNTIKFTLSRGSISLAGGYTIRDRLSLFKSHGTMTTNMTDVKLAFAVELESSTHRMLRIKAIPDQCKPLVGNIDMQFQNKYRFILDALNEHFRPDIDRDERNLLCPSLFRLIDVMNSFLDQKLSYLDIFGDLKFDFGLVGNPEANNLFVDFPLKGETVNVIKGYEPPFGPPSINPTYIEEGRTAMIYLSDYVFTSFSFQLWKAGLLDEIHLENKQNGNISNLLRLNCKKDEECLGKFAPDMSRTFKDGTARLLMTWMAYPQTHFINGRATVSVRFNLTLQYDRLSTKMTTDVLTFDAAFAIDVISIAINKTSIQTQKIITVQAQVEDSVAITNEKPNCEEIKPIVRRLPIIVGATAQKALDEISYPFAISPELSFDASFRDDILAVGIDAPPSIL